MSDIRMSRQQATRLVVTLLVLWGLLLATEHLRGLLGTSESQTGALGGRSPAPATSADPTSREREGPRNDVSSDIRHGGLELRLGLDEPVVIEEPPHSYDEHGFRNVSGALAREPDLVVIGNSFSMYGGTGLRLHELLEERTALRAYNAGITGADRRDPPGILFDHPVLGPFFREHPPRYVVWTLAERMLQPEIFRRLLARTDVQEASFGDTGAMRGIGHAFAVAEEAMASRMDSSPFNIYARRFFHYRLSPWLADLTQRLEFRNLSNARASTSEAVGSPTMVSTNTLAVAMADGSRVLFDHLGFKRMQRLGDRDAADDLQIIRAGLLHVQTLLRARGSKLIVVLIPEKRVVYRRYFDGHPRFDYADASERRLELLTTLAREAGLDVVNLLPVFQRHASPGSDWLYYPTETHWSIAGRELAAGLIEPLLR